MNGGTLIGSCKTPAELGEMITKLAEHPNTRQIHIALFRRDYDPMITPEKMAAIIKADGDDRMELIRGLSDSPPTSPTPSTPANTI